MDRALDPRAGIRRDMRRRRRALKPTERRRRSHAVQRRVATSQRFLASRRIALFLPNDGEVDLRPLIERAWRMGKECFLPVLGPMGHNRLWFAPYRPDSLMVRNRFGIPEPHTRWDLTVSAWALDLVLAPLVAFDREGNRLGMGGGFYDRTLNYLFRRRRWCRPHLLGVAYAFQECERLPRQPWDVPLDGIVTDAGEVSPR